MHQKPSQSTHKIQNFLGGMPPDPLEVVGPRAHQVPWLAPASRYAPALYYTLPTSVRVRERELAMCAFIGSTKLN